jgi:hypothetical protein
MSDSKTPDTPITRIDERYGEVTVYKSIEGIDKNNNKKYTELCFSGGDYYIGHRSFCMDRKFYTTKRFIMDQVTTLEEAQEVFKSWTGQ